MDTQLAILAPIRATPAPPAIVAVTGLKLDRQRFDWRRPFRRRLFVLTYQARRFGYDRWETCISFHRTSREAISHLNQQVVPLHYGAGL